MNVLIVEDNPNIFRHLLKDLNDLGHFVYAAHDSSEGMEVVESTEHIDFIITDINLPNDRIEDFIEHIHESRGEIPVIVVAGKISRSVLLVLKKLHCKDILVMPYEKSRLAHDLENDSQ